MSSHMDLRSIFNGKTPYFHIKTHYFLTTYQFYNYYKNKSIHTKYLND